MASQPLAFGELLAGGVLVTAALTGSSVKDVIAGKAGPFKGFSLASGGAATADASAGGSGKLVGTPLDRPGVPTSAAILDFARRVAGVLGKPVRLGTGSAHSQMTTSGNVSAHWTGRALDLPAAGQDNINLGRAALVAAGMDSGTAAGAHGGVYNVGRYQIIFQTNVGGNHFNHVHIGLRG